MGNWRDAGGGVQLWKPTKNPEIDVTEQSLARLSVSRDVEDHETCSDKYDSDGSDLPSMEENLRVKQEIYQRLFPSPGLVSTLRSSSHAEVFSSPAVHIQSPSPTVDDNTFKDIKTVATFPALSSSTANSNDVDITPQTEASTCDEYDSDRTDFLTTPQTPCPIKTSRSVRQTGLTSRHFPTSKATKTGPVRRTLDFGNISSTKGKPTKMCLPEYQPTHRWNDEEREFLCVCWRWYERAPVNFAKLFNKAFKLDLKTSTVTAQLENHLRLYGAQAFPVFGAVMSVPFHDPEGVYDNVRHRIEATALLLDIDLRKLKEEATSPSGAARHAKSSKTRKLYKSLVRRASQENAETSQRSSERTATQLPPLGGISLQPHAEFELMVESETFSSPILQPKKPKQKFPNSEPKLGFRVWDEASRAKFSEENGFVSEAFSIWKRPFLKPFNPDSVQGKQAINLLCNLHLNKDSGGASSWISISVSLLQAFVKASSMKKPSVVLIDLGHPSLLERNKVLKAAEILRDLKSERQAYWARYKGHAERLIWADIPREAILYHGSLGGIITLADTYKSVANLLGLEEFRAGRRTLSVSSSLRDRSLVLDRACAEAMGQVCKQFGLQGNQILLQHIKELVVCLVDGWTIKDVNSITEAAPAFAAALDSRVHSATDVMLAFEDGMQQGTTNIEYFAARRRQSEARRGRSTKKRRAAIV